MLLTLGTIGVFYFGVYKRKLSHEGKAYIELRTFQSSHGWGYDILQDGKPFIHQDIVPVLSTQWGFRSKEDALAVGKIVYDRLVKGEMPMITGDEIAKLGIVPDSVKH